MAKVIDVHTHMFTPRWMDILRDNGDDKCGILTRNGMEAIHWRGTSIVPMARNLVDWDIRIAEMDAAGVDIAVISLTAPNVYWGSREVSNQAARAINDDFALAQVKYKGRIRWFASLPWEYPDDAKAELIRAKFSGAVGVCTLTNIGGVELIDPRFAPIWREIEAMRMPVFIHPTTPYVDGMGISQYGLANTIGFTTETSLCFAKMIHSGFLDRYPNLNVIACHGGGALPYLRARFDRGHDIDMGGAASVIKDKPSSYYSRLWYDAIVYDQPTLDFLVNVVGYERVLYGSDYPFQLGDMKGCLARVNALANPARDAVRGGNAAKLFDL